jgi:hypothetical protein
MDVVALEVVIVNAHYYKSLKKPLIMDITQMKEGNLFFFTTWFQLFQVIWICQKICEAMRQKK